MLISAREERARRFKLALRAGMPILAFVSLLFYTTFSRERPITLSIENALLMAGLVFIIVYFIYFLLELDVKETLLDNITEGFHQVAFNEKLRKKKPKTVAILLINNLATINENYGVNATNSLLHTLVTRLNNNIYAHDINESWIGRSNGAEFLIALDVESNFAQTMIEDFIEENQTIETIELDYRFAVICNRESDPEHTIAQLRDELSSQELKESEEKSIVKDTTQLSYLEHSITKALREESLNFYFRPLYNIQKDSIDSYEISIKLQSNDGKEILPRDFLPVINRLGLGRTYDLAIFKHVLEVAMLTDDHISYSFNLSPFSLRDRDFLEKIFTLLEEKELDAKRLIIQLYERKTHHNLGKYLKTLSKIRATGIRICVDNFGSSNSSLEYMKYFKFDMVQFDRDFVTHLDKSTNRSVLKSLIEMSKEMQVTTIAKWVDNDTQKIELKQLGVDYLQGFGVGKQFTERELIQYYN